MTSNRVKLLPYQLHPKEAALIEWGRKHKYGRINIVYQDGIPVQALVPTKDGLGIESVLFDKVAILKEG